MSEFVITFGYGQRDKNGSLANCCTRIEAESVASARLRIEKVRGDKWCNIYGKDEGERIIADFAVREIPFNEIGPQGGENL